MKRVLYVSVAVALLAAPAFAQDADVDPNWSADRAAPSGGNWTFGTEMYCGVGEAQLQAATGNNGHLGIQYVAGGDFYWGSSRDTAGGNRVYKFDSMGALLPGQDFTQIAGASSDAWGYRDLASDGEFLYGGWGGGIARHDIANGANPTMVCPGGGPNGTWRALAYDPDGDQGRGSLWSASFASGLVEVSITNCAILNSFTNLDGWSLYGLAMDPCDPNMLWGYSSPNQGEVVQIDKTTGRQTGLAYFPTCVPGTAVLPGRGGEIGCQVQGGLTGVPGGAFGSGNFFDLVSLGQATLDTIVGNVVYVDDCNSEPGECDSGGPICDPCDMDCVPPVNALDIEFFIGLLFDNAVPCCGTRGVPGSTGDVNGDGSINALDIEGFINCLFP